MSQNCLCILRSRCAETAYMVFLWPEQKTKNVNRKNISSNNFTPKELILWPPFLANAFSPQWAIFTAQKRLFLSPSWSNPNQWCFYIPVNKTQLLSVLTSKTKFCHALTGTPSAASRHCLMIYNYFPIVKLSKLVVAVVTDITTYRGTIIAKLLYVSLHFITILMYYWNWVDNDYLNSRLQTNWSPTDIATWRH